MLALRNVGCRWVNAQLALDSATHSRLVECIGPEFSPSNTLQGSLFHAWDLELAMILSEFQCAPNLMPKITIFLLEFYISIEGPCAISGQTPKMRDISHYQWMVCPILIGNPMNSPYFERRFMYPSLTVFPKVVVHIDL